jgi:hypothetical protein
MGRNKYNFLFAVYFGSFSILFVLFISPCVLGVLRLFRLFDCSSACSFAFLNLSLVSFIPLFIRRFKLHLSTAYFPKMLTMHMTEFYVHL